MRIRFFVSMIMLLFGFMQSSYVASCCSTSNSCCTTGSYVDQAVGQDQIINIKNDSGQPIDLVCRIPEHTEAVLRLRKLPKPELKMELFKAILKDDADRIKLIVQAGANIDQEFNSIRPLALAIKHEKLKAFNTLLECGADIHFMHQAKKLILYALGSAPLGDSKRLRMACLLIKKGADFFGKLRSYNGDVMHFAVMSGRLELIKALVNKGYNVNNIEEYTFCWITNANKPKILKFFLRSGLNPNMVRKWRGNSWSLLSWSINCGNLEEVKLLLQAGADPNLKVSNKSPLSYAMGKGHIEIIELLESYGAHL